MTATTISPRQLQEQVQAGRGVELIDVRTPVEFREVHVGFARNVPLDQLQPQAIAADRSGSGQPLYVICRTGNRAQQAGRRLADAGVADVVLVEGGLQAWDQAGLPVVRGRKAISLERQVRIAAGFLVVLGSALGAWVSPWWIALAAFVGAGLVFAGVTDTCGMGMLLARMPWNQVKDSAPACESSASAGDSARCAS